MQIVHSIKMSRRTSAACDVNDLNILKVSQFLQGGDFAAVWTIQARYVGSVGFPSYAVRWLSVCSWVSLTIAEVPGHPCGQQLFLGQLTDMAVFGFT